MVSIAVLGSTGSIGTQTLEIVRGAPDDYDVVAIAAGSSVDKVLEQAEEFRPRYIAVAEEKHAPELIERAPLECEVVYGPDALGELATSADVIINGVVGFAGLPVTLSALAASKRLGLANKESLISAGPVVQRAWATPGAELIPVDSEHCAIHQCLRANDNADRMHKIVLTASGGPFRGRSRTDLSDVSIDDALAHPTWSMGPKITIDSSTLMNKGLEVIEAHELFGASYDDIDVVVHPQSVIHSMVTYTDGCTMAQLSMPDMRLPIGYALAYPDRLGQPFGAIDWAELRRLDFEPPDHDAFPCLELCYAAGRLGETAPAWLNAANEVVVEGFLRGLMPWLGIADTLSEVLDAWPGDQADSLEAVLVMDKRARDLTRQIISRSAAA